MKVDAVIKKLRREMGVTLLGSMPDDPFKILISTVLSQRTRDENTALASRKLFSKFDTPKKLAEARPGEIEKRIRPSGFYRVKARYIRDISRQLVKRFGGKVPDNIDDLLSLSGVGRKTANCVLVYAFRMPAIPVDTHVHRISNRLGWVKTKTAVETEIELAKVIDKKHWIELNELMVKYGQRVCRPIRPLCQECQITKYCDYFKENQG